MNKIMLIGHLGRDPEMHYTDSGKAVARFSLAVTRKTKSANGERETDWFNVTLFDKLAEISNQYLKKGHQACIEGRIQFRKYTDKASGEERTSVDVIGSDLEMLTAKSEQSSRSDQGEDALDSALSAPF